MIDLNTIIASIFSKICIMATLWKSCRHSIYNGVDMVELWEIYQNITTPEANPPSKHVMKLQSISSHNAQCISQLQMQVSQCPRHGHDSQGRYMYPNVSTHIPM